VKFSFKEKKNRLLVIDFGNLFYFSKPTHLNEELLQGRYSVVEQFIINLNSYIWQFKPSSVVIADDCKANWRYALYPLYKQNRKEKEFEEIDIAYRKNREKLTEILKEFPLYYLKIENLEADDICYLICNKFRDVETIVMSGDSDLLQLTQKFYNVKVYNPNKKNILDKPELDIVRYKILKGDSSDNIKGFPKIGEVKAKVILKDKKTFNAWYNNLSKEELELYSNLKNIICLDKIPKEYKDNFNTVFNEYKFKEFDLEKIMNIVYEYELDRINLKYINENFNNLKPIYE